MARDETACQLGQPTYAPAMRNFSGRVAVVEAMRADRLYVLPHPEILRQVRRRLESIEADALATSH